MILGFHNPRTRCREMTLGITLALFQAFWAFA
jgi:hypothetical protein